MANPNKIEIPIRVFRHEDEALDHLYPDCVTQEGDTIPQDIRIDAYFLPQKDKDQFFNESQTLSQFKNKIEKALHEKSKKRNAADKAYDAALDAYEKQQIDWRSIQEDIQIKEIELSGDLI